jgi:hypothetical protein
MFDLDSRCTPVCKQTWRAAAAAAAAFQRIWGIGWKTLKPIGRKGKKKNSLITFKAASQPRLEQIRVVTTCFFSPYSQYLISISYFLSLSMCVLMGRYVFLLFNTLLLVEYSGCLHPNDSPLTTVYNRKLIFFLFTFYKFMASKDISSSNISSQNIIANPSVTIWSGYYAQFYICISLSCLHFFFALALWPNVGHGLLILEVF